MRRHIYLTMVTLLIGATSYLNKAEAQTSDLQFNRNVDELVSELKELDEFEDANIKTTANESEEETGRHLKIYLKNGKHLNESNSFKNQIGKEAMQLVLNSIENGSDFSDFTVYFVTEKEYGGMDMRSENPFPYTLKDFN